MGTKNLHWDDVGELVERYDSKCRAEGCDKDIYAANNNGGRGYCGNHYNLWLRNGEPLTVKEIQFRNAREAAFAYADEPNRDTLRALCMAALSCHVMWDRGHQPGPNFEMMLSTAPAAKLAQYAVEYAEHDSEAPLADYERARDAYYHQIRCFERRWRYLNFQARETAKAQPVMQEAA